jgi:hypothetical protein
MQWKKNRSGEFGSNGVLFKGNIMAVYCENHMKYKYILLGTMQSFFLLIHVVHVFNHKALNDYLNRTIDVVNIAVRLQTCVQEIFLFLNLSVL